MPLKDELPWVATDDQLDQGATLDCEASVDQLESEVVLPLADELV